MMNNYNNLLNSLGGINGVRNRLDGFSKEFNNSTNKTPQEIGLQIKNQMSPVQFQLFAAIADAVVGRK